MKYCIKCGNKIKDDSKFCTKCGNPTKLGKEKIKEENEIKRQEENERFLLKVGVSLIILSSIIFAFITWRDSSDIFKICFLSVETLIFFAMSLISKKIGSNNSYKSFWFIGSIMIPIIFILVIHYNFYLKESGLYVYLSMCSVICFIIYLISYKYTKSNIYLYLNCILLNLFILFIMLSFNLDKYFNNNADLVFTISIFFNLLLSILCLIKKDNKYSHIFINYMKFVSFIYLPFIISYTTYEESNMITLILSNIMYLINLYIIIMYNKNSSYNSFAPFILTIISLVFINTIFNNYNNMTLYLSSLTLLLSLFISYLLNIKNFKIITFIVNILSFICILSYSMSYNYVVSIIISLVLIVSSLFILKVEENSEIKSIVNIIIPLLIYILINSLISSIMIVKSTYIIIVTSLIYSIIYAFLVVRKNKKASIYEFFSYMFLIFAIFSSVISYNKLSSIITEVLCIYYLIFKVLFDKKKTIINYLFSLSILNLIFVFANFNIKLYYTLLIMSLLLIIISLVYKNNNKIFSVFGIILLVISSLFNFSNYSIFALLFNLILYIVVYFLIFRKNNIKFIFKFIYVILGLFIITKIITSLIDQVFISSLISLIISIIILITMFLAEEDSDRKILSYTIYLIYLYYMIINSINVLSEYNLLMLSLLITIYVFIFLEKVFNVNKSEKIVFEILWLIYTFLNFISTYNIINVIYLLVLSIISIFIGIKNKTNTFIYYGSITLIINVFLQFIKLNFGFAFAFTLLLLGIILVYYVLIKEIKKQKK